MRKNGISKNVLLAAAAGLAISSAAQAQFIISPGSGAFTDISTTGTLVITGDDSSGPVAVSAAVANAAFPAGTINACTNGHAGYSVVDLQYTNLTVPNAGFYGGNQAAAVFWDDLITNAAGAGVYSQETTEGGVPVLIIQWNAMDHFSSSPSTGTFELKIFGGAGGPGGALAQYIYQDVDFGDPVNYNNGISATVGYQVSGTSGAQFSFNTASISNGMVLSILADTATGACCLPTGACTPGITAASCLAQNGVFQGVNSQCGTCPQPGACCITAGCVIALPAACTAQNGSFQGAGTTCATANCPQPCPAITGAIGGPSVGWPSTHGTQNTRLFRDGIPDTCALSAPGGAPLAGSFAYDKYDFSNTSGNPACVNVDINTACTGTNFIYAGAYIGAYDPNNPSTNNVASCGGSPNPTANMSFNVPANAAFSIVFAEVTPGAGCPNYTFQLSGGALSCNSSPCYANCDHSTTQPCLNVLDFGCFLNKFSSGDTYANCDNSTTAPVLNVLDFGCFLNKFAAGCSNC